MFKSYDKIPNNHVFKIIRLGIVIFNSKNEVLLLKRRIDRINKVIYDIPYIETDNINQSAVINGINEKYGISLKEISGYINETHVLNEKCDNILQINMCSFSDEDFHIDSGMWWAKCHEIIDSEFITDGLKNCLEIFNYNCNCSI